jgi:hypothetical protein
MGRSSKLSSSEACQKYKADLAVKVGNITEKTPHLRTKDTGPKIDAEPAK